MRGLPKLSIFCRLATKPESNIRTRRCSFAWESTPTLQMGSLLTLRNPRHLHREIWDSWVVNDEIAMYKTAKEGGYIFTSLRNSTVTKGSYHIASPFSCELDRFTRRPRLTTIEHEQWWFVSEREITMRINVTMSIWSFGPSLTCSAPISQADRCIMWQLVLVHPVRITSIPQ